MRSVMDTRPEDENEKLKFIAKSLSHNLTVEQYNHLLSMMFRVAEKLNKWEPCDDEYVQIDDAVILVQAAYVMGQNDRDMSVDKLRQEDWDCERWKKWILGR